MMPKSDFVGTVPSVKGHGIPVIRPPLFPESTSVERSFSVVVSKAIAKTPEPPKVSEQVRAQPSSRLKQLPGPAISSGVSDGAEPAPAITSKEKHESSAIVPLKTGDTIDASIAGAVMTAMVQPSTVSPIPQARNSRKADGSDLAIDSESFEGSLTAPTKQAVRFTAVAAVEERATQEESSQESSPDLAGAANAMNGKYGNNDARGLPSMQPLFFAPARESVLTGWESSEKPAQTVVSADAPALTQAVAPGDFRSQVPRPLQAKDLLAALAADDGFPARVSNAALHARLPAHFNENPDTRRLHSPFPCKGLLRFPRKASHRPIPAMSGTSKFQNLPNSLARRP